MGFVMLDCCRGMPAVRWPKLAKKISKSGLMLIMNAR